MSAPVNVLHVTTGMGEGGAEAMLARLIAHSDASRVRHHLLALSLEGPLWEPTSRACASALNLLLDRPLAAMSRLSRLRRFIRDSDPDLIEGWMYHGNLAASWLRSRYASTTPVVFGIRQSLYDIRRERPLTRAIIRAGAKYSSGATSVVYNSGISRQQHSALGYCDERSCVISNGFDTRKFAPDDMVRAQTRASLGIGDSEFVVGMVGRFHPVKDHATFVRASAMLARDHPGVRALIVGPGCTGENAALRELVRQHGGTARIDLLGAWRNTETLYPALDAFCLTSQSEGFPNVVGEAMSCGVTSVCTSVGDIPLLLGEAGSLAAVGDFSTIATHLLRIARFDAAQRAAASNSARHRIVVNFEIEDMIDSYMKLYSEVTGASGGADGLRQ